MWKGSQKLKMWWKWKTLEVLENKETLKNRETIGQTKECQHQNYKNFKNKKQKMGVGGSITTKVLVF